MIESTNRTLPTVAQATKSNISHMLNEALSTLANMQEMIEKPETFISDTLNEFFDCYIEKANKGKNLDTLALMTYAAQHYQVYIETALEYVKRISEDMESLYTDLTNVYQCMPGGVNNE